MIIQVQWLSMRTTDELIGPEILLKDDKMSRPKFKGLKITSTIIN